MQDNSVLEETGTRLFDKFKNKWYAFPKGPVEDDIYSYWYLKSSNPDYIPPDYGDKHILADFLRERVGYTGKSSNKYNLKMLYFCCLLEDFYRELPFFDKDGISLKNNRDKIVALVKDVKLLLSKYFKTEDYTAENLISLSHNLSLWHHYYSTVEFKKIPTDDRGKMKMEAMTFFARVNRIEI